ncbi:unnamed protein product, partial [Ixodes persulcatus]
LIAAAHIRRATQASGQYLQCQSTRSRYGCRVSCEVNCVCGEARGLYQVSTPAKTQYPERQVAACILVCYPTGQEAAPHAGWHWCLEQPLPLLPAAPRVPAPALRDVAPASPGAPGAAARQPARSQHRPFRAVQAGFVRRVRRHQESEWPGRQRGTTWIRTVLARSRVHTPVLGLCAALTSKGVRVASSTRAFALQKHLPVLIAVMEMAFNLLQLAKYCKCRSAKDETQERGHTTSACPMSFLFLCLIFCT